MGCCRMIHVEAEDAAGECAFAKESELANEP